MLQKQDIHFIFTVKSMTNFRHTRNAQSSLGHVQYTRHPFLALPALSYSITRICKRETRTRVIRLFNLHKFLILYISKCFWL